MSIRLLIPYQSYEATRVQQELLELGKEDPKNLTWDSIYHPMIEFPDALLRFSPRIHIIYQLINQLWK